MENDELLTPIDKDSALPKAKDNDDSFDIENSGELNKVISEYESDMMEKKNSSDNMLGLKKISSNNDSFDEAIVDDLDQVEREVNSGRHSS